MRTFIAVLLTFALSFPLPAYSAKKKKKKPPTGVLCLLSAENKILARKKCKQGEFLLDATGLIQFVASNVTIPDDSIAAPGESIRGRLRASFSTTGAAALFSASSDFTKLITTLPSENIIIKLTSALAAACPDLSACLGSSELANTTNLSSQCTGTFELPTAPEGRLCIYPALFSNILVFQAEGLSPTTFFVDWVVDGTINLGITELDASWSYTEPSTAAAARSARLRREVVQRSSNKLQTFMSR